MNQPALSYSASVRAAASVSEGPRWLATLGSWALDLVLVNAGFILAYLIRYPLGFPAQVSGFNYVQFRDFVSTELTLTVVMAVVLPFAGLYRAARGAGMLRQATAIFNGTTVSIGLLIVLTYLSRVYAESRLLYISAWALIIVLLSLGKAMQGGVRSWLYRRGVGVDNLIVVGASDVGKMVMQHVAAQPGLGYQLLGFLDDVPHADGRFGRFPQLGRIDQLEEVIREHGVSEVIIALPPSSHQHVWELISYCQEQNVHFRVIPDLFEMSLSRVDVDEIAGIPVIGFREGAIAGGNFVLKRGLDILISGLLLLLSAPLWLLLPLAIKLDSKGPVLYRQIRVGKDGAHFTFFKFRSMREGAEDEWHRLRAFNETEGPILKIRNDPRLTRVGRFIRRWSIDEVPQLLNILRGEMSLVGPRPPLPAEVMQYEPWQRKRLSVAGGLTGLWQVSGRSHLNFEEMVLMDIYYIENWSLGLDLSILLKTIPAILTGTGSF